MTAVTYTTVASGAQAGWESGNPGSWATLPGSGLRLLTNNHWLGFVFDLSGAAGDGVNRPVFGGLLALSLELTTITQDPANKSFGGLWFTEVPETELFGASNLPSTLTQRLQLLSFSAGDLVAGMNTVVVDPEDLSVSVALRQNTRRLLGLMGSSRWNGLLALQVGPLSGAAGQVNSPVASDSLVVDETPFHTGFAGWPVGRGRAVHDGRSGFPALADELVEDGYTPGLYVRRRWWNPEDREGEAELPNTEGEVEDEVSS